MKRQAEKRKRRSPLKDIQSNIFLLKIICKTYPSRILTAMLYAIFGALEAIFAIIFLRYILIFFERESGLTEVIILIATAVSVLALIQIYSSWYNHKHKPITDRIITNEINRMIFKKAVSVDLECYENPEFYNRYSGSISQMNYRITQVLENSTSLLAKIISAIYLIYIAVQLDFWTVLFLIIPICSVFLYRYFDLLNFRRYWEDIIPNRKREYVGRTILLKQFAKEIRLSNIFNVLKNTYINADKESEKIIDKYKNQTFIMRFLESFLNHPLTMMAVWLYVAYRAMISQSLGINDFVVLGMAITIAAVTVLGMMNNFVQITENDRYITIFKNFLEHEPKISEDQDGLVPQKPVNLLEFKNVCFKYKEDSKYILENINFKINIGEKIALVGHNGAGKSTLVKLIMRLYDPTEGEIFLNEINIKEYNVKEYRKLFGTVFQDYKILSMSVAENVMMSEPDNEEDRINSIESLKKAGVYEKISSLKNEIDTVLTREFDDEGAVLSGGEFQKIAIARIFAKDNSILILDEPSSALDPIAEDKMYRTLMKTYDSNDPKIVIYISHRLSAAKLSDKILMLENGKLIEEGTHNELINKDGKYSDMFKKQSESYLKNESSPSGGGVL